MLKFRTISKTYREDFEMYFYFYFHLGLQECHWLIPNQGSRVQQSESLYLIVLTETRLSRNISKKSIANFVKMIVITEKWTSDSESVIKNDLESIKDFVDHQNCWPVLLSRDKNVILSGKKWVGWFVVYIK